MQERDPTANKAVGGGPLAYLVKGGRERALDLWLLINAVTSAGDFSVTEWSNTWARAIGLPHPTAGPEAVSRALKVLDDAKLISRERVGKQTRITKLLEDGSGKKYEPPTGGTSRYYFQLPFEYWTDGYHNQLTLPGKALLLIAMSSRDPNAEFCLTQQQVHDWYGISPRTVSRGMKDLQENDLLVHTRDDWYDTLATQTGRARKPVYALQEPFKPRGLKPTIQAPSAE